MSGVLSTIGDSTPGKLHFQNQKPFIHSQLPNLNSMCFTGFKAQMPTGPGEGELGEAPNVPLLIFYNLVKLFPNLPKKH
jgi:hypothetical protein